MRGKGMGDEKGGEGKERAKEWYGRGRVGEVCTCLVFLRIFIPIILYFRSFGGRLR